MNEFRTALLAVNGSTSPLPLSVGTKSSKVAEETLLSPVSTGSTGGLVP